MGFMQGAKAWSEPDYIQRHYDIVSPYYQSLWGEHIHHGYWTSGEESKEQAQVQLIEHLAAAAGVEPGATILDVGCGIGGSSIYLAKKYQSQVTGITISPVQVEMATRAAAREDVSAKFLLMNAEEMEFAEPLDVIWSVESISHYRHPKKFFARAATLLKPGGTLAITDWFEKENLPAAIRDKYIPPIEKSMMVELHTIKDYEAWMEGCGLQIVKTEILNEHCAKTWDVCMDIVNNKTFWKLAAQNGAEFLTFLRGFKAMRAGFRSGNFIYGLMVARLAV